MAFGRESSGEPGWPRADTTQSPHWMKVLEEKYQRLHAKIINQSARFTFRRPVHAVVHTNVARRVKAVRHSQDRSSTGSSNNNNNNNNNNTSAADYSEELNHDPSSVQVCQDVANGAESVKCPRGSLAKKGVIRNQLTCADLRASETETQANNKLCTDGGSKDIRFVVEDQEANGCAQTTPYTSGNVTRVPSSLALTRLSSACEPNHGQRGVSSARQQASELRLALNSHLNGDDDDNYVNNDDEFPAGDEYEDEVFLFRSTGPIIEGEDEEFDETCVENNIDEDGEDDGALKVQTAREGGMEVSKARRRHDRGVKTSMSRVSLKTTKSCPATFLDPALAHASLDPKNINNSNNNNSKSGARTVNNHDVPNSVLPLTSRGVHEGRMRVFARMSLEARHAVDETLKEMKKEEDTQSPVYAHGRSREETELPWPGDPDRRRVDSDLFSVQNNTSGHGNWRSAADGEEDNGSMVAASDVSLPSNNSLAYATKENNELSHRLQNNSNHVHNNNNNNNNNNYNINNTNNNNNNNGCGLLGGFPGYLQKDTQKSQDLSRSPKLASRKLPQMQHNGVPVSSSFPNPHLRLPDIGHAVPNFRENTFEITPPDFDIRFHHVITCSQGNSETPPPDIRQQSIEKCQQWLVRYTPRR